MSPAQPPGRGAGGSGPARLGRDLIAPRSSLSAGPSRPKNKIEDVTKHLYCAKNVAYDIHEDHGYLVVIEQDRAEHQRGKQRTEAREHTRAIPEQVQKRSCSRKTARSPKQSQVSQMQSQRSREPRTKRQASTQEPSELSEAAAHPDQCALLCIRAAEESFWTDQDLPSSRGVRHPSLLR